MIYRFSTWLLNHGWHWMQIESRRDQARDRWTLMNPIWRYTIYLTIAATALGLALR